MRERFKDAEHLFRLAGLAAVGVVLFLLAREALIPAGFGELGFFRVGAMADNRDHRPAYAGRAACVACHEDVAEARSGGAHEGVGCEACHGPLATHAADPAASEALRPDPLQLCPVCHQQNVAKPEGFPQVDAPDHSDGESCTGCHDPHNPGLS